MVNPPAPANLIEMYDLLQADPVGPHGLVIVPSLTFDLELLAKITGAVYYEERLLAMLLMLDAPSVRLVFCTSLPIDPVIIDYYLGFLPATSVAEARTRLTLVSCDDDSPRALSEKLLTRPEAVAAVQRGLEGCAAKALTCVNTTAVEERLAAAVGVTLLGNPPLHSSLGSKSGSREIFRVAGIELPDGVERLPDLMAAARGLAELRARNPRLRRAVVKVEEGFSGEGNAIYEFGPDDTDANGIAARLPHDLQLSSDSATPESYAAKFASEGGIVEEFLADVYASPSGQGYIDARGAVRPLSTHDQILDGQVFLGSVFPAAEHYRQQVQRDTVAVGQILAAGGARGRFAVDFVAAGERVCALEINLRRGGTTHPLLTAAKLVRGYYDPQRGELISARGVPKSYYSTDNLTAPEFVGISPATVIAASAERGLTFDRSTERGIVFHMLGALKEYGKVGVTCIADNAADALTLFRDCQEMLAELGRFRA
ncbi:MAG: peptide ligase PGM1-related protein [Candidatus Nanopelagicales bacterium]